MAAKKCIPRDRELFSADLLSATPSDLMPDFSFLKPLRPTIVFATYWRFAVERQEIYLRRVKGEPGPWSTDAVLQSHKFTNAYRASDRVSQYLIRNVIGDDSRAVQDTFFRVLLFKLFNKIETWELIVRSLGEPSADRFDVEEFDRILLKAFERGERLYSAAYIMPSGGRGEYKRKHSMHLNLLSRMLREELPRRVAEAACMRDAFELLRSYPSIGDFLAYQFVTDLNYSTITNFSETEFVVPATFGSLFFGL